MIDVRDNWRVLFLVALCLLAALALFGPLGASGDSDFGGGAVPDPLANTTTDDAGEYELELPAGDYDVLVDEIGYDRFQDELEVTGSNETTFDVELTRNETGTVSGTITDGEGPVAAADVEFVANDTEEPALTVTTDSDGSYEADLDPGEYSASVEGLAVETTRETVTVEAGETTSLDIDVTAIDTGLLEGTVTSDGEPVPNLALSVTTTGPGGPTVEPVTDENGSFEATVRAGDLRVRVEDTRFEPFEELVTVETTNATAVDINLTRVETGTLSGAVTGDGTALSEATVVVSTPETEQVLATDTTGADGGYEVELEPATYNVSVDPLLYESAEQQVTLPATGETLDFGLEGLETGTVTGTITADGEPVSGAEVNFFDPAAGLGDEIDDEGIADPTNLQYGLELSGGARIRGEFVGLTAENVDIGTDESGPLARDIAERLGLEGIDVSVKTSLDTVEIFTDNVTQQEFAEALSAAGYDVGEGDIRDGVTGPTRDQAQTTLTQRVDQTGFSGADVFTTSDIAGNNFIVAEVPGVTRGELREIITDPGRVQVIAGFPDETDEGVVYNQTTLLDGSDISSVGNAQRPNARRPNPRVPVTLTGDAAQRFETVLNEAGYTQQRGIGNCFFDAEQFDAPAQQHESQYCLFLVVDGEYVHGSSMGGDLAQTLRNEGQFALDPSFVLETSSFDDAQQVEINLQSGELPTEIDIVSESFISPSLAQLFKPLALLTALVAWLSVSLVVYYWYRDVRVAVPMLVTAGSEVFLLLGFAAAIGLALDLSHIAGLIAVIGTGLDDLIIMADEILQRKQDVETGRVFRSRFRKAFWIIGMAAATTIVAMSPLAVLSLGDLQGFAIITIVGVLIGVAVTRPAYGDVLRKLMLDDVKRTE
jgi:preprotein translocase subunit SecD